MQITYNDNFTVEDLGEIEIDVYDIEVEHDHNFFANNILVHNSTYLDVSNLMIKVFGSKDVSNEDAEKFLDSMFKEKIEDVLEVEYDRLAATMGAYRNAMVMKREKICNKALWTAPKKYILSTLNSEGVHYDTPKISVTGLESVRSSTPKVCREAMKKLFNVMLSGTETDVQNFISEFKSEFKKLPASEIAKNSGTDSIEKYMDKVSLYKKGCPMHVRGCIMYNERLKTTKLLDRYETIKSGDKIKFIYLKTPNVTRENIISFISDIPSEWNLDEYIDYETQFEKVFLKPMRTILEAIGWSDEKRFTLEDFF